MAGRITCHPCRNILNEKYKLLTMANFPKLATSQHEYGHTGSASLNFDDTGKAQQLAGGLSYSRLDLVVEDEAEALVLIVWHHLLPQSGVCLLRERALRSAHTGDETRTVAAGVRPQLLTKARVPTTAVPVLQAGVEPRTGFPI